RLSQTGHAEEDQLLVAVTRRWIEGAEPFDPRRHAANLFFALAPRRRLGRLAFVDASCRKFPQLAIYWRAVLPDQDDPAILFKRNQHDGWCVAHDDDVVLLAVRVSPARFLDRKDAASIDDRHESALSVDRARAANRRAAGSRIPFGVRRLGA